jgi:hypothetical protein
MLSGVPSCKRTFSAQRPTAKESFNRLFTIRDQICFVPVGPRPGLSGG